MMIWYLLAHFDRSLFDIRIVSFSSGELMKQLPTDVKGYVITRTLSLFEKVLFKLGIHVLSRSIRRIQEEFKADIWYVNTIILPEVYVEAPAFGVKIVTHFHELPLSFEALKRQDMVRIIELSDMLIGCAQCVCDAIEVSGGKNVRLLHSFIDTSRIHFDSKKGEAIRAQLQIKKTDTVWVVSGKCDTRKGFDFLPKIAAQLPNSHHIIWLGSSMESAYSAYVESAISQSKYGAKIHLLGVQDVDYYDYLALSDGFLLLSREDPFPLVMLEAAYLNKPIFSFDSGGVREFLQDGMGKIISNFDTLAMAEILKDFKPEHPVSSLNISRDRAMQFDSNPQMRAWEKLMLRM